MNDRTLKRFISVGYILLGGFMMLMGLYYPDVFSTVWVRFIIDIRTAIISGDSGNLIMTATTWSIMAMSQKVLYLLGYVLMYDALIKPFKKQVFLWHVLRGMGFVGCILGANASGVVSIEVYTTCFSGLLVLLLASLVSENGTNKLRLFALSVQVFLVFHWFNIVTFLPNDALATTDLAKSIQIAAKYLGSDQVINSLSLAAMIILFLTTLLTLVLFKVYDHNIWMAKEQLETEVALDAMRNKMVQNRMYDEIHAMTHDLKTPLVTIRGLNSLMTMTSDNEKVLEYTERVDNAVNKMTDMISGFLYESSKQVIHTSHLIDYVRAQIPLEDEATEIDFEFDDPLPFLYINKIRVSRAILNVIENALYVKTNAAMKQISIKVVSLEDRLLVAIRDNGMGIESEEIDKIWTIGYTTKETTGVGLAFVKKVFEDNGGSVDIRSQVNEGTAVLMVLPVHKDDA